MEILRQPRMLNILLRDVVDMREKMRGYFGSGVNETFFDLKHDRGGIVDIEFMVQYQVLAHAEAYSELATYTDNIRQLDGLSESGCISIADAGMLKRAYVRYRGLSHEAILADREGQVSVDVIETERRQVEAIWTKWMSF